MLVLGYLDIIDRFGNKSEFLRRFPTEDFELSRLYFQRWENRSKLASLLQEIPVDSMYIPSDSTRQRVARGQAEEGCGPLRIPGVRGRVSEAERYRSGR